MLEFNQKPITEINITIQDIIDILMAHYRDKLAGRTLVEGAVFVPDTDFDATPNATIRHFYKQIHFLNLKLRSQNNVCD